MGTVKTEPEDLVLKPQSCTKFNQAFADPPCSCTKVSLAATQAHSSLFPSQATPTSTLIPESMVTFIEQAKQTIENFLPASKRPVPGLGVPEFNHTPPAPPRTPGFGTANDQPPRFTPPTDSPFSNMTTQTKAAAVTAEADLSPAESFKLLSQTSYGETLGKSSFSQAGVLKRRASVFGSPSPLNLALTPPASTVFIECAKRFGDPAEQSASVGKCQVQDVAPAAIGDVTASLTVVKKLDGPKFVAGDPCITFLIGKDGAKFHAHKTNICYYSPVLNKLFAASQKAELVHRIEDTGEQAFELFVNWIYTQELSFTIVGTTTSTALIPIVEVYILAEKLNIPRLQNLAIMQLEKVSSQFPLFAFSTAIRTIWEKTSAGSPLRRLLVNHMVHDNSKLPLTNVVKDLPLELLQDLVLAFRDRCDGKTVVSAMVPRNMAEYRVKE